MPSVERTYMHIECATIYELYVSLLMPLSLALPPGDSHAFGDDPFGTLVDPKMDVSVTEENVFVFSPPSRIGQGISKR